MPLRARLVQVLVRVLFGRRWSCHGGCWQCPFCNAVSCLAPLVLLQSPMLSGIYANAIFPLYPHPKLAHRKAAQLCRKDLLFMGNVRMPLPRIPKQRVIPEYPPKKKQAQLPKPLTTAFGRASCWATRMSASWFSTSPTRGRLCQTKVVPSENTSPCLKVGYGPSKNWLRISFWCPFKSRKGTINKNTHPDTYIHTHTGWKLNA